MWTRSATPVRSSSHDPRSLYRIPKGTYHTGLGLGRSSRAAQVRYAQSCCQRNQYFQELHPDERKQFRNIDILTSMSRESPEKSPAHCLSDAESSPDAEEPGAVDEVGSLVAKLAGAQPRWFSNCYQTPTAHLGSKTPL